MTDRPGDAALMLSLGSVYLQNGKIDAAIEILTRAHALNPPEMIPIRVKLGAAHYAAGLSAMLLENDKGTALVHFNRALEIAPHDAAYLENLSQAIREAQLDGD